jgi:hypothetical protein
LISCAWVLPSRLILFDLTFSLVSLLSPYKASTQTNLTGGKNL